MIKIIRTVIFVTQDPILKQEISHILVQFDYSVIFVESAIKSLLKILEQKIEFFILDIETMKNYNLDYIKILKKIRPRMPIIIICSDTSIQTLRQFAELGIFYCILKPVKKSEIEQIILALQRTSDNTIIKQRRKIAKKINKLLKPQC